LELAKRFEGKKFMWDGNEYESMSEAERRASEYSEKGFEVRVIEIEGKFYVYSRRVSELSKEEKNLQGG